MKRMFLLAGALATVTATAACGGGSSMNSNGAAEPVAVTETSPGATPTTESSPMTSPMTTASPFGTACAAIPSSGPGSSQAMAGDPVVTAASNNPQLSTFVEAVKKAGLADTLNSSKALTVFAPDNEAFAAVPREQLDKILANKQELTKILKYHVVDGRLTPEQLEASQPVSLEGGKLHVKGSGQDFTVNGAKVVCGNIQTSNATVYMIDKVLMPPS
ncbi:fasciclin domain-containing protein [Acrocarpospora catenulata]|uniref:fasciclin domain-containing protein n=1 Tax=Acrocarpospora catenulata TaxID=2836182 RepID=UPI001BDA9472|nr:fasciclin domain-containing protein [Acrocarpospora catenulata]